MLQPAAGLPNGVEINLRFPVQYYDSKSGLHYNLNRYYNPELGRYMEPDPIGLKGGLNPYAYAGNDPVNNTDPTGLCVGPLLPVCAGATFAGRMVYLNAPRIGAFAEGLLPSAAGSAGVAYTGSKLASNMAKAGNPVEKGVQQAHHIVAQRAQAAQPARDILEKHGIGIHSAENGAAMLKTAHQSTHTKVNYEGVNRTIQEADAAGGKPQVLDAMAGLQQQLQQQLQLQMQRNTNR